MAFIGEFYPSRSREAFKCLKPGAPDDHIVDSSIDPQTGDFRARMSFTTAGPQTLLGLSVDIQVGDQDRSIRKLVPGRGGIRKQNLTGEELEALTNFTRGATSEKLSRIHRAAQSIFSLSK